MGRYGLGQCVGQPSNFRIVGAQRRAAHRSQLTLRGQWSRITGGNHPARHRNGDTMNAAAPAVRARESHFRLIVILAVLAAAMLWFFARKAHYLTDYSLASYSNYFWPRRQGLLLHLAGGLAAITVGLIQIWLGLTNRTNQLHRVLGKVYGAGVLIGSIGGFYLAFTIPESLSYKTGLTLLNVAWLVTTGMALYAIRTRRVQQHRDWMIRSYTVTFAFITYRLGTTLLRQWVHVPGSEVADEIDNIMAWACWAVPLLLVEPFIQLRAMKRSGGNSGLSRAL